MTARNLQKKLAPDEEQVLNLIMAAEIPSVDSSIVEDQVGFNVLNNIMEGLYRLTKTVFQYLLWQMVSQKLVKMD